MDRLDKSDWDWSAFFEEAFKGTPVPPDIRRAATRICTAYHITGLADPGYIANVIARSMGLGDGAGNFGKKHASEEAPMRCPKCNSPRIIISNPHDNWHCSHCGTVGVKA